MMIRHQIRPTAHQELAVVNRRRRLHQPTRRAGFTLIELLVVILIILLVSAVALPTIIPAVSHRQVSEAARILQGALAGARDVAIRDNTPSGIRLIPDAVFNGLDANGNFNQFLPLAYNRMIPIGPAPEYTEGLVSSFNRNNSAKWVIPAGSPNPLAYWNYNVASGQWATNSTYLNLITSSTNVIVLEECDVIPSTIATAPPGLRAPPTSWFWNIRVGDKIQINNAGAWYTVVGPMAIPPSGSGNTIPGGPYANPEMFVNVGPPGTPSALNEPNNNFNQYPEFLYLVNGQDDNNNAWVDEGWDGVDNNGDGNIDEPAEWESEQFQGTLLSHPPFGQAYTIQRRPAPLANAREVTLPSSVVIDASSWGLTNERTRVPHSAFNQFSGYIEILVNPDGSVVPTTIYSSPASLGMDGAFCHFWLAERSDVYPPNQTQIAATTPPYLPVPQGMPAPASFSGAALKGEYRLVTVFTRTGQTTTNDMVAFDNFNAPANGTTYNVNLPFVEAQQGVSGGQR